MMSLPWRLLLSLTTIGQRVELVAIAEWGRRNMVGGSLGHSVSSYRGNTSHPVGIQ